MTAERAARLTALGLVWDQNEAKWEAQLARLVAYKAKHGDCSVPQDWAADSALGRWVNSQRVGKRKLDRGEPSEGMTVARAARLTALGLNWHPPRRNIPNEAEWDAQLARLVAYKAEHGDCSVPRGWSEDPRLGNWVNIQRVRKQKLDRGEPGKGMTAARAAKLDALGFACKPAAAAKTRPATLVEVAQPGMAQDTCAGDIGTGLSTQVSGRRSSVRGGPHILSSTSDEGKSPGKEDTLETQQQIHSAHRQSYVGALSIRTINNRKQRFDNAKKMLTEKVMTLDGQNSIQTLYKPPDWGTLGDSGESVCKQFYRVFEGVEMPGDAADADAQADAQAAAEELYKKSTKDYNVCELFYGQYDPLTDGEEDGAEAKKKYKKVYKEHGSLERWGVGELSKRKLLCKRNERKDWFDNAKKMLTEKVSMVTLDDKPPDWGTLDDWGESLCKQFYLAFEGVKMPADAENAEDRKIYKDSTKEYHICELFYADYNESNDESNDGPEELDKAKQKYENAKTKYAQEKALMVGKMRSQRDKKAADDVLTDDQATIKALVGMHLSGSAAHVHNSRQLRYFTAQRERGLGGIHKSYGKEEKPLSQGDTLEFELKALKEKIVCEIEKDIAEMVHVDENDIENLAKRFGKASRMKIEVCGFCGTRDIAQGPYIESKNLRKMDDVEWAVVSADRLKLLKPLLDESVTLLDKDKKKVSITRGELLHLYIDKSDVSRKDESEYRGYHVVDIALSKKRSGIEVLEHVTPKATRQVWQVNFSHGGKIKRVGHYATKKAADAALEATKAAYKNDEELLTCMQCSGCAKETTSAKKKHTAHFVAPTHWDLRPDFDEMQTLYNDMAPKFSIAAGFDFGRVSELYKKINKPTMKETLVISTVRCFFVTVKVVANGKVTDRDRLVGHFVAFPHRAEWVDPCLAGAPTTIEEQVKFNEKAVTAAAKQLPILFVGPKGCGARLKAAAKEIPDIKCTVPGLHNLFALAELLRGRANVPDYTEELADAEATRKKWEKMHVDDAVHQDDEKSAVVEEMAIGSDIANIGASARSGQASSTANDAVADDTTRENAALPPRMHSVGVHEAVQLGMSDLVDGVARVCRREPDPEAAAAAADAADAAPAAAPPLRVVGQGDTPLDDYGGHTEILYEAFSHLFPLRRGLEGGKPLNKQATRRLMTFYDGRCVRNKSLLAHCLIGCDW
jgi:hypothetical protein